MTIIFTIMPLLAYGSMMISNSLTSGIDALRVIGLILMGLPLVAAFTKVWTRRQ